MKETKRMSPNNGSDLATLLNEQTQGDQQPLRKLRQLAHRTGRSIAELVQMEAADLGHLVVEHGLDTRLRYGRQILLAYGRLVAAFPDSNLPVPRPLDKISLPSLIGNVPKALQCDIESWVQQASAESADLDAHSEKAQKTISNFASSILTAASALREAGVPIEHLSFGDLVAPRVIALWLPLVSQYLKPGSIAAMLSAMRAMAHDQLGPDHAHTKNLRLVKPLKSVKPALSSDKQKQMRDFCEPQAVAALVNAGAALMQSAYDDDISERHQLQRAASALGYQLLCDHQILSVGDLAQIRLDEHFRLDVTPPVLVKPDGQTVLLLTSVSVQLYHELDHLRSYYGVKSKLLFPGATGELREPRSISETIYLHLVKVTSLAVKVSDLHTIATYLGLSANPERAAEAAAALGHQDSRSVRRRFEPLIRAPRRGPV